MRAPGIFFACISLFNRLSKKIAKMRTNNVDFLFITWYKGLIL